MGTLLGMLTGPVGKIGMYLTIAISLMSAAAIALHEHDNRVLAEAQVAENVKIQADKDAQTARTIAALTQSVTDAEARSTHLATARSTVDAAPKTVACKDSPAIRAALDSLRKPPSGGAGTTGTNPGGTVPTVPHPAGTPSNPHK